MPEKTALFLEEETSTAWRDLASSLNLFISRGPGAGELGNIKALMDAIANVSQTSPEVVRASLLQVLNWQQGHAPEVRPWIDLTCGHTWLADADGSMDACPVCGDDSGQIRPVTDFKRIGNGTYRPYQEDTTWASMANRSLELASQD